MLQLFQADASPSKEPDKQSVIVFVGINQITHSFINFTKLNFFNDLIPRNVLFWDHILPPGPWWLLIKFIFQFYNMVSQQSNFSCLAHFHLVQTIQDEVLSLLNLKILCE